MTSAVGFVPVRCRCSRPRRCSSTSAGQASVISRSASISRLCSAVCVATMTIGLRLPFGPSRSSSWSSSHMRSVQGSNGCGAAVFRCPLPAALVGVERVGDRRADQQYGRTIPVCLGGRGDDRCWVHDIYSDLALEVGPERHVRGGARNAGYGTPHASPNERRGWPCKSARAVSPRVADMARTYPPRSEVPAGQLADYAAM